MRMLLILLLFTLPASAASFDCAKASTTTEKVICSSNRLSALDRELAATYAAARKSGEAVRESQRKWLAETRAECEDYDECLEQVYLTRIATLRLQNRSLFAKQKPPARILGRYSEMTEDCKPIDDPNSEEDYECEGELENFVDIQRTGRGNAMTVESELWFHMGHMCSISAAPAEWVGGELRVSLLDYENVECTLIMRIEKDQLEIYDPALRCKNHCGARGNFDETFLTKKKR